MKPGVQDLRRCAGFLLAQDTSLGTPVLRAAAVTGRQIEIVRFKTGLPETQQRSGHVKLDVIRVGANGDSNRGSHYSGPATSTGLPVSAERSAAKITR